MHRPTNRRTKAMLLATILTAGLMAIWIFVIMVGSIVALPFYRGRPMDQLTFTLEGQPIIQSWDTQQSYPDYAYRTLDGKTIEAPDSQHFQSSYTWHELPPADQPDNTAGQWLWRIASFRQGRPTPAYWYLIHDDQADGRAYFAGYQPQSRRRIGYLGRKGFDRNVPPRDDQFSIPLMLFQGGAYAPRRGDRGASVPQNAAALPQLYLAADEALWRVDLTRQSVEPVAAAGKVVAVSSYDDLVAVPDDRLAVEKQQLVVRLPEALQIMSMESEPLRTIPLPEAIRGQTLSLVGTITDERIVVARDQEDYTSPRDIYWISPDGSVTRHEQVALYTSPPNDARKTAWIFTGIIPIPLALAVGTLLAATFGRSAGEPSSFTAAMTEIIATGWLPFLVLLAVSLALAVVCYRRHRRIVPTDALMWAAFVFLLGPPGWVGYWTHRRWPPRARCEHCGADVPRDRGTCLACGAEFSPPALLGSEVFA